MTRRSEPSYLHDSIFFNLKEENLFKYKEKEESEFNPGGPSGWCLFPVSSIILDIVLLNFVKELPLFVNMGSNVDRNTSTTLT